ncbi:hypothetical protein Leryth_009946 [Lithospermum erythrorhizon]|nr:hypothetical protein Leryth_009946 [Lithospermum erythrorhizon]
MNRKRTTPYSSSTTTTKRRRSIHHRLSAAPDTSSSAAKSPSTVVVMGLPIECSVLDLKSRFEIYGPISRTRMDPNGLAYVTFRAQEAAEEAIAAAKDPSFQLTIQSRPLQVMWATDPVPQWREAVSRKDGVSALSSKLVRAEMPLSRRGRGNKLGSTIVNPRDEMNDMNGNENKGTENGSSDLVDISEKTNGDIVGVSTPSIIDATFKGREIVAYDDIL